MKKNYIIIHGSFGSPFVNWFSWLYNNLTDKGSDAIVPQFPIDKNQNYENWSDLLKYYWNLGLINENTVIIGHSIAPIFITKFLIENRIKVSKLVFVSGFNFAKVNQEYDKVNESFFTNDIERIHEYCEHIICIYSNNDPYLKYDDLEEFANKVSDVKQVIENGGHLNGECGYTSFEEIVKYL